VSGGLFEFNKNYIPPILIGRDGKKNRTGMHSIRHSERQYLPSVYLIQYLGNAAIDCGKAAECSFTTGKNLKFFVSGLCY